MPKSFIVAKHNFLDVVRDVARDCLVLYDVGHTVFGPDGCGAEIGQSDYGDVGVRTICVRVWLPRSDWKSSDITLKLDSRDREWLGW